MKLLWKAKMTTIHDGGEEVEEGAVYHVTLKRVQIHQAANKGARWLGVEEDQLPPEHTVSQYETCKIRTIKAGTLEKLVENLLTAFGDNDFTYISVFLSTYRAFASTKDVLELLLDRYGNLETSSYEEDGFQNSSESNAALRTAIASILRAWLDQCSEDFREPPNHPCLLKLLDYLKRSIPGSDPERRAQNLLEHFHNQDIENTGGFYDTSFSSLDVEEDLDISNLDELEFSFFQDTLVAEQLTYMDAKLFKKVVPHHCLGSIWSKRNKKENEHLVPTVRATITQFNAVTKCVVSTILKSKELKIQQRAKIIEKWIHVAHECRILKNFSSLRAIISALQSNSIYHLKKSWACVPKDIVLLFEELSDIFSNNDNSLTSRELLMKEGTSKFANLDSSVRENQKRTQRRLQLQKDMGVMQGTVPYLGTFLTDLVMLDTAFHDYIEGGLINFEKRRKEFEVIAQIKLLQSACNSYCLTPDKRFIQWFQRQQNLTEEESYNISREIEATADTSSTSPKSRKSMVKRFSLLFVGSDVIVHSTPVKEHQPPAPGGSPAESTDSASISSSDLNHSESEDVCSTLKSASDSEPQNKLFDTSKSPEGGTSETSCFSSSSTATPSSQPAFLTPASVSSPKDKCSVSNSTSASEFRCSISDSIDKCSISVSQCSDPNAINSVSISHSSAMSSTSIPLTDTTSSICKAAYSICSATGSSSASEDKDADCDPKDMDSDCDSKDKDSDGDCQDKDSDGDCKDKDSDGDGKDKDSDPLSHSDSCSFSYSNSRSNSCSDSHSDSRSRSNSHSDSDCDNKGSGSGSTDKDYDFGSPTKRSDSRNKACTTSEHLRPVYNHQNSDSCIIRVSMDNNNGNMYKSILITCQDKTYAVIQRAMLKHNLESDTVKEYELVQVISEAKELVLPHTANVFYAMNSHVNYDFILRKKASVSGEGKTRGLCSVMFSRTADKRGHGTNRHSKFVL